MKIGIIVKITEIVLKRHLAFFVIFSILQTKIGICILCDVEYIMMHH